MICLLLVYSVRKFPAGEAALNLFILVADKDMEFGLRGILQRPLHLGIRKIESKIFVHPNHDPGVFRQCHELLRSQQRIAAHALAIFDRHGCGSESPREDLEHEVEMRLVQNGWQDRSASIAIEPELEAWVWGEYPRVADLVGWPEQRESLQQWLTRQGLLLPGRAKPERPKEAFEHTLYTLKKPKSPSLYFTLGNRLNIDRCLDPAFLKLRSTLQRWFPIADSH
ncbi:MAG: hypothetical protein HY651_00720 [Acidobacteria bacterium]|nr:hypothetical protein [Acidobacteriota bacterium]